MFHIHLGLIGAVLAGSAIVSCALTVIPPVRAAEPIAVTYPGKQGVMLKGFVYKPKGVGPFPAVIALHGCSGLTDKDGLPSTRHADLGNRLAAHGFLVLFPDSYASRGLGPHVSSAAGSRIALVSPAVRQSGTGKPDLSLREPAAGAEETSWP